MIKRLNQKNTLDVQLFLNDVIDRFSEFYITANNERYFLKNNRSLINKILKRQEVYGLFENGLRGLLLVFREKNFRTYIKFLSYSNNYNRDLLKFFLWNYISQEVYCKIKKENSFSRILQNKGFMATGDRGSEMLLVKKAIKNLKPIRNKDEYLDYENLYYKRVK